jgi:hypothetical protein
VTLREVIARLDEFAADGTIYAESAMGSAEAVVAREPEDATSAPATDLPYLLEVSAAREAIEVWGAWRPDRSPTLDDRVAAVVHYATHDAWLPVE